MGGSWKQEFSLAVSTDLRLPGNFWNDYIILNAGCLIHAGISGKASENAQPVLTDMLFHVISGCCHMILYLLDYTVLQNFQNNAAVL